jgi:hypothetical protein
MNSFSLAQRSLVVTVLSIFSLTACGQTRTQSISSEPSPPPPALPEGAPPSSLPAEERDPWREIKITSDYAEIKIDPSGHYSISRNNCWVAGYGAISQVDWEFLETQLSDITRKNRQVSEQEKCFEHGSRARALKGPVELSFENGVKLNLITFQYPNLLCSQHYPVESIQSFARALDSILPQAFAEDCTLPANPY